MTHLFSRSNTRPPVPNSPQHNEKDLATYSYTQHPRPQQKCHAKTPADNYSYLGPQYASLSALNQPRVNPQAVNQVFFGGHYECSETFKKELEKCHRMITSTTHRDQGVHEGDD